MRIGYGIVRLCACGCGQLAPKYYDKNGTFKTYRKYVVGHIPTSFPTTPAMLEALANGRKTNWANPEYRAKMSRISSETMKKTNAGRALGRYPEWEKKHSENMKIRAPQMWRDGTLARAQHQRFGIFRSRLEKSFAEYLTSLNIAWEYEPKAFDVELYRRICRYTPDFFLPGMQHWIEIKGFWRDQESRDKVDAFQRQNPNIKFSVLDRTFTVTSGYDFQIIGRLF